MWMGIQGDTINGFGCGPKGPHDCSVGTTPGEHWARRGREGNMKQQQLAADTKTQKLSPVYTPNTKPTLQWNGLPEHHKNDLWRDSEHMDDYYTKDNLDPFGAKGQYGMWMGIQGDTINGFGCGPGGPADCTVGTTPGEHWARRPAMRKEGQKLRVNVVRGASLPWSPLDENPDEKVTADPFNSKGQYGYYMGINDGTRYPGASWGCGPNGPSDCSVGTTPGQHWAKQAQRGQMAMQVFLIPPYTRTHTHSLTLSHTNSSLSLAQSLIPTPLHRLSLSHNLHTHAHAPCKMTWTLSVCVCVCVCDPIHNSLGPTVACEWLVHANGVCMRLKSVFMPRIPRTCVCDASFALAAVVGLSSPWSSVGLRCVSMCCVGVLQVCLRRAWRVSNVYHHVCRACRWSTSPTLR